MDMQMGRLLSTLYQLCKWITHFAYLNLLWVVFTFVGGVVFGLFPSTVTLFTIARKNTMGASDFPVFRTLLETFRNEFIRANGLGWLVLLMGVIWYFDLNFFRQFEGLFFIVMDYFMVVVGLIYLILLLYILPVYVHYDLK